MVFVPTNSNVERLKAYLTAKLKAEDLESIHQAFELGACSRFSPLLQLYIEDILEYHDLSHSDIRRAETAAGRDSSFLIIDEETPSNGAVWYIDQFASEDQVDDGEAESTEVLWKIHVKTEEVPLMWVNYDIANMSIEEDLDNCGVDSPVTEDFEQPEIYTSGLDMREEQRHQDTWITAEPGEFEESTDEELRKNFMPRPDKVARLKEGVAEANGLLNRWMIPSPARPETLPDGSTKTFPEGSVVLQLRFDPDFDWPPYRRPEGSL